MNVESGTQLLHYTLTDKIGEGGMGAVWKATDTTLNRDVAVKLLPPMFAEDPERRARFEREAKTLASLNHPNVAAVYGLHQDQGVHFLVMEYVAGEDLSFQLARGPLPLDTALDVATQMAAGIEAAHENGVIHRDLKPANVIVTPQGNVKLLDFGLAKGFERDTGSSDPSLSPTMTSAGTVAGMILGTAAYMSPEQARGKPLDRRTDLWSFGCVVYECLTGKSLFAGETVSDSLAAILRKEPDWSALPDTTPPLVRLMLKRCLARDVDKRLRDAGDARLELQHAIENPDAGLERVESTSSSSGWLPWALMVAALVVAGYFAFTGSTEERSTPRETRRFTITIPGSTRIGDTFASPPAISPDGRSIVFGVGERQSQLWIRSIDDVESRRLPDTQSAQFVFWSPDSRHIGFFMGGRLRRMEVATRRVQQISESGSSYSRGGSWGIDDTIIFAPDANSGIHVVDASGGEPRPVTTPDPNVPDASHRWPYFLPDGNHFLYLSWTNDVKARQEHGGVFLASVDGKTKPHRVIEDASSMAYAPSGHILVTREENLIAVPFDEKTLTVNGEAQVVVSGVLRNRATGHSAFSVSGEGTLLYAGGQAFPPTSLSWADRSGAQADIGVDPAPFNWVELSPDERRAAVTLYGATGDEQIWLIDLRRGLRSLFASGPSAYTTPLWSGDGSELLFTSQDNGPLNVYRRPADGSGEMTLVLSDDQDIMVFDWSRDGRSVLFWPVGSGQGTSDLWVVEVESEKKTLVAEGDAAYTDGRFSPDGKLIVYATDESGRSEIFVQSLVTGGRWQVSTVGGELPRWRGDGKEIVYFDPDQTLQAVSVDTRQDSVTLGAPVALFAIEDVIVTFDSSGDHSRFLIATRTEGATEPLQIVLNWDAKP